MNLQLLFPTVVANFELDDPLTEDEQNILCNLKRRRNTSNTTSEDTYVLNDQKLFRLKNFFINSINKYLNDVIIPEDECNLYITQSWTNYTESFQAHHRHNHPNSIISGVFYVNVEPQRDKIYFYRKELPQIKMNSKIYNSLNSDSWWLPVKNNLLILFPSYIDHEVKFVDEGITRVSLAFNTFINGKMGSKAGLTELILGENNGKGI